MKEYQYVLELNSDTKYSSVKVGSVCAKNLAEANQMAKEIVKRDYSHLKTHLYTITESDKLR